MNTAYICLRAEGRNIWLVYGARKYFTTELREEISDWSMVGGNILPQSWGKKYLIGLCCEEILYLRAEGRNIWLVYAARIYFTSELREEIFDWSMPRGIILPQRQRKLNLAPGRVLRYISHEGTCRPEGYGFWAFLVWKRVYILPILVWNRVWFLRELWKRMNVFIFSLPNE